MDAPTAPMTAFVLAGGRSRRFTTEKAAHPWAGRPLLAHAVALLRRAFAEVRVVGRAGVDYAAWCDAPVVRDRFPDCGPLGGIHAGLRAAPAGWAFFAACDMPLLRPEVVALLVAGCAPGVQAVVPEAGGWRVPTLGCYHASGLPELEARLARGQRAAQGYLDAVDTRVVPEAALRRVDPGLQSLTNLNTLAQWRQAAGRAAPE